MRTDKNYLFKIKYFLSKTYFLFYIYIIINNVKKIFEIKYVLNKNEIY